MDKKVALITGASSGMGKRMAFELMEKGFCVYAGARRIEQMKEIEAGGGNIVALDITNEESMCACVESILKKEGRIDILINNAGYGSCGAVEDLLLRLEDGIIQPNMPWNLLVMHYVWNYENTILR